MFEVKTMNNIAQQGLDELAAQNLAVDPAADKPEEKAAGPKKSAKKIKKAESVEEFTVEIDSSEASAPLRPTETQSAATQPKDTETHSKELFSDGSSEVSDHKIDAAAAAIGTQILVNKEAEYKLHPRQVHETYDISFDDLIKEIVSPEFEESCLPMLKKIEQNFKICKGGTFFLRGQSGIGKSRFFNNANAFSEKTKDSENQTFRVVASDANIFDFDFMIFINLIKTAF